ncbi:hypothetical protein ABIA33_002649 [Streptacidiphilus sp. MAP12-16]|uniref:hypothetical protein n=1 Tax=Streptacidiphilus sp. MAP12-16 TaxID=3156300 RepID=UPI0035196DAB
MSLDPEFTTSGAVVGLASVNQLWSAARSRPWPQAPEAWLSAAARRRRTANRLMSAALMLTLVLGAAATIQWADAGIQGTPTAPYPPLLWPLVLFVGGIVVSIVANTLPGPTVRPPVVARTAPTMSEMPSLFSDRSTPTDLGGGHHHHGF